jgi:SAM-dependent methyltransferase
MDNVWTKNTLPEVDFLIEELALPSGGSVLDVGCGTGRHSIELARRGYSVTGLDLSRQMLARAAVAAEAAGVGVGLDPLGCQPVLATRTVRRRHLPLARGPSGSSARRTTPSASHCRSSPTYLDP